MKITKAKLQEIIRQEIKSLHEDSYDRERDARAMGYRSAAEADRDNWGRPKSSKKKKQTNEHTDTPEFKALMKRFDNLISKAEQFGSDAKRKPDVYSDATGHKIVDKLKELYNAAIYGDRKDDRSKEVFK